jgi:hypothetical protein
VSVPDDRKMFAPLRRAQMISPELKLPVLLTGHQGGATAAILTDQLDAAGMVVGRRAPIVKRIGELLDDLERSGRVERLPDGWYRSRSGALTEPTMSRHKRLLPRVASQPGRRSEGDEGQLPNAWPTGLRTMPCLACDAPFLSAGRHERLCASCRRPKA